MSALFTFFFALNFQLGHAQDHDHSHHEHTEIKETSPKVRFVPTDDLKVRMDKVLGLSKELSGEKVDSKSASHIGKKIQETVNDIFKTCKLEPKADAAIHPALGKILSGTRDLQSGKVEEGRKKIHESLLLYGKLFEHQGWAP